MTNPDKTGKKQGRGSQATQFKPNQSGNPKGRPKGARSKLSETFLKELLKNFNTNGPEAIEIMRVEKPSEYVRVIASLVPKDLNLNITDDAEGLTDDQARERIDALTRRLDSLGMLGRAGDAGQQSGDEAIH